MSSIVSVSETLKLAALSCESPILKALRLLGYVAECNSPVALADLTRALGLPKPTSYRLARALEENGYLYKDPLTKRFLIGARFEDIAFSAVRNGAGHGKRRLLMDELADRIGTRINVAVVKAGKLLFVEWVESSAPLRVDLKPGVDIPVHCTASGKLLIAFGPDRLKDAFLRSAPFAAMTRQTIVSGRAMARELDEIRRRGFAEDREEYLPGVNCLAVPIRNSAGNVVAGLAAMAPVASLPLSRLRRHAPELIACAEGMAKEFVPAMGGARQGERAARGRKQAVKERAVRS